jgi:thioesterase DpgC
MNRHESSSAVVGQLASVGLPTDEVRTWANAQPAVTGDFAADCRSHVHFWNLTSGLLRRLPTAATQQQPECKASQFIREIARATRTRFLQRHADAVYDRLTANRSRFVRIEELVVMAGREFQGLVPLSEDIAAEDGSLQRDKRGLEIDHGLFLSALLRSERSGRHLCHAMLLPRQDSTSYWELFQKSGKVEFPGASIERQGKAALLTYRNPRFLNAEDQTTLDAMEICVDLALLDEGIEVAVLRGGLVDHPKYNNRRVFGSGINLTHLYHGKIPYLWYLQRDLGYVNKLYRGLATPDDAPPDECGGLSKEKPWIAAVETFAIGGHCQVLLAVDYVIAERTAFMTLPARKEGIIPGAANMRLPRAVGDRIARQAIQYERRIECDSPEGRLICDEIVEQGSMDAAIERVVTGLTSSGVVSAASNRRAFRIAQEPLDMFRQYFAVYAREQAYCHFSAALISNLERYWNAQSRKV